VIGLDDARAPALPRLRPRLAGGSLLMLGAGGDFRLDAVFHAVAPIGRIVRFVGHAISAPGRDDAVTPAADPAGVLDCAYFRRFEPSVRRGVGSIGEALFKTGLTGAGRRFNPGGRVSPSQIPVDLPAVAFSLLQDVAGAVRGRGGGGGGQNC